MKECAGVLAKLIGGPQDGECIMMNPAPGVGPPLHLTYPGTRRDSDQPFLWVIDVYEAWPYLPCWPDAGTGSPVEYGTGSDLRLLADVVIVEYHHQGTAQFNYRKYKDTP